MSGKLGTGATAGAGTEDAGAFTVGEETWFNFPSYSKLLVCLGSNIGIRLAMSGDLPEVAFGFADETLLSDSDLILSIFSSGTARLIPDSCCHFLLVCALRLLYLLVSNKSS